VINLNPSTNINPNFCSYRYAVKNKFGLVINRGNTCFFRHDLAFDDLIRHIYTKHKNVPKVNIIAHACSDGEEAYSFLIKMIDYLGNKEAEKFLPILAKDIEQTNIDVAKNGKYHIESFEKGAIDFYMGKNFYNYLLPTESKNSVKVSDSIKDKIIFSKSDILEDVKNIDFNNTVLLARNFWHYLEEENIDKLAMNLSHRMNKSSTLVIGDYDKQYNIDRILNRYGFQELYGLENVFEKFR
jgi:chemotaxis methyl-accepting protein methylase